MGSQTNICEIQSDLLETLKKFRFSKKKENHGIVMKIDRENQMIIEDYKIENCSTEDLIVDVPTHQPRFIVYSFAHNHSDGRISYPMTLIFFTPPGSFPNNFGFAGVSMELSMMYAGSISNLIKVTGM